MGIKDGFNLAAGWLLFRFAFGIMCLCLMAGACSALVAFSPKKQAVTQVQKQAPIHKSEIAFKKRVGK